MAQGQQRMERFKMAKLKAVGTVLLSCLVYLGVALFPPPIQANSILACTTSGDEHSSVVNFSGFRWHPKSKRARNLDPYEFGSAAHALIILSAEDITWDGQPVDLDTIPQKLNKLTGRGTKDMALKVLVDEEVDFSLVHRVIKEINKANICNFSIKNMRLYSAFASHEELPNPNMKLTFPNDVTDTDLMLTASTVALAQGKIGVIGRFDSVSECSVYYKRTEIDSFALLQLISRRLASQKQKARELGSSTQGLSKGGFLSTGIFVQAPPNAPWRCVAGVLSNVKEAGYGTVTLRILSE